MLRLNLQSNGFSLSSSRLIRRNRAILIGLNGNGVDSLEGSADGDIRGRHSKGSFVTVHSHRYGFLLLCSLRSNLTDNELVKRIIFIRRNRQGNRFIHSSSGLVGFDCTILSLINGNVVRLIGRGDRHIAVRHEEVGGGALLVGGHEVDIVALLAILNGGGYQETSELLSLGNIGSQIDALALHGSGHFIGASALGDGNRNGFGSFFFAFFLRQRRNVILLCSGQASKGNNMLCVGGGQAVFVKIDLLTVGTDTNLRIGQFIGMAVGLVGLNLLIRICTGAGAQTVFGAGLGVGRLKAGGRISLLRGIAAGFVDIVHGHLIHNDGTPHELLVVILVIIVGHHAAAVGIIIVGFQLIRLTGIIPLNTDGAIAQVGVGQVGGNGNTQDCLSLRSVKGRFPAVGIGTILVGCGIIPDRQGRNGMVADCALVVSGVLAVNSVERIGDKSGIILGHNIAVGILLHLSHRIAPAVNHLVTLFIHHSFHHRSLILGVENVIIDLNFVQGIAFCQIIGEDGVVQIKVQLISGGIQCHGVGHAGIDLVHGLINGQQVLDEIGGGSGDGGAVGFRHIVLIIFGGLGVGCDRATVQRVALGSKLINGAITEVYQGVAVDIRLFAGIKQLIKIDILTAHHRAEVLLSAIAHILIKVGSGAGAGMKGVGFLGIGERSANVHIAIAVTHVAHIVHLVAYVRRLAVQVGVGLGIRVIPVVTIEVHRTNRRAEPCIGEGVIAIGFLIVLVLRLPLMMSHQILADDADNIAILIILRLANKFFGIDRNSAVFQIHDDGSVGSIAGFIRIQHQVLVVLVHTKGGTLHGDRLDILTVILRGKGILLLDVCLLAGVFIGPGLIGLDVGSAIVERVDIIVVPVILLSEILGGHQEVVMYQIAIGLGTGLVHADHVDIIVAGVHIIPVVLAALVGTDTVEIVNVIEVATAESLPGDTGFCGIAEVHNLAKVNNVVAGFLQLFGGLPAAVLILVNFGESVLNQIVIGGRIAQADRTVIDALLTVELLGEQGAKNGHLNGIGGSLLGHIGHTAHIELGLLTQPVMKHQQLLHGSGIVTKAVHNGHGLVPHIQQQIFIVVDIGDEGLGQVVDHHHHIGVGNQLILGNAAHIAHSAEGAVIGIFGGPVGRGNTKAIGILTVEINHLVIIHIDQRLGQVLLRLEQTIGVLVMGFRQIGVITIGKDHHLRAIVVHVIGVDIRNIQRLACGEALKRLRIATGGRIGNFLTVLDGIEISAIVSLGGIAGLQRHGFAADRACELKFGDLVGIVKVDDQSRVAGLRVKAQRVRILLAILGLGIDNLRDQCPVDGDLVGVNRAILFGGQRMTVAGLGIIIDDLGGGVFLAVGAGNGGGVSILALEARLGSNTLTGQAGGLVFRLTDFIVITVAAIVDSCIGPAAILTLRPVVLGRIGIGVLTVRGLIFPEEVKLILTVGVLGGIEAVGAFLHVGLGQFIGRFDQNIVISSDIVSGLNLIHGGDHHGGYGKGNGSGNTVLHLISHIGDRFRQIIGAQRILHRSRQFRFGQAIAGSIQAALIACCPDFFHQRIFEGGIVHTRLLFDGSLHLFGGGRRHNQIVRRILAHRRNGRLDQICGVRECDRRLSRTGLHCGSSALRSSSCLGNGGLCTGCQNGGGQRLHCHGSSNQRRCHTLQIEAHLLSSFDPKQHYGIK